VPQFANAVLIFAVKKTPKSNYSWQQQQQQ